MKRDRAPTSTIRAPAPFTADPVARIGGAVLRGVAVHHEPRALPRPPPNRSLDEPGHPARIERAPERRSERVDPLGGAIGADAVDTDARIAAPAASAFEQGRLAGYAEAEAAQRVAVEEALQRGNQAGFEQGLAEGRQQGTAQGREAGRQAVEREASAAQEATAARLAQLDRLLSTVPVELATRLESAEDDMVALCHAVVCRILGEQLVTREGVAHAVREAVRNGCAGSTLDDACRGPLAIHVHPRDLELLCGDEHVAAWLRRDDASASAVRWLADDRVQLGGCIVSSGEGSLDARIETQLAALRELLLRGRSAGPAAAASPPAVPAVPPASPEDGR